MSQELTIKQEKFILKYFECGNATEAYKYAYSTSRMKPDVINVKASQLLSDGKVTVRLNELRAKAEEESQWNVKKVLDTYTRVIEIGLGDVASSHLVTEGAGDGITNTIEVEMRDTNLTAVNTALTNIAKHLGMFEKDNKQKADEISLADFAEDFYNRQMVKKNEEN